MARKLKYYPSVALNAGDFDGQIDFVRVFGRTGPVHVEIGCGKATFLLNEARAHCHWNFVGIEKAGRYYRHSVDRIGRWGLSNVRIVGAEASQFLADSVPDNSVDCFHIYFPDPWPKRRHHKRRFFCAANVEHLIRCLKPGGDIRIATDYVEYFDQIRAVLKIYGTRLEQVDFAPTAGADEGEWVGTNFERKYLKDERPIYTVALRKK